MAEVSLIDGHIDNRMSDEDIIKALECCKECNTTGSIDECCIKCPLSDYMGCCDKLIVELADFFNRQKTEIENLNIELKAMRGAANSYKAEVKKYEHIEQTVKDFWSELKKMSSFKDLQEPTLTELLEYIDYANAEAIKEFAERLKCNASILCDKVTGLPCSYTVSNYDFNRLIKEMTESK